MPPEVVRDLVALAVRAPSAGFSQGWDFVALLDPADREAFWSATDDGTPAGRLAPRCRRPPPPSCSACRDPGAYLDRYAEPDKGWTDRSTDHWPVPYWDTDVAMAAMVHAARRRRTPAWAPCSSGCPVERHDAVREALGIPDGRRLVGVVALGHEAERVSGSPRTRRRRPLDEVLHVGRFGSVVREGERHRRL